MEDIFDRDWRARLFCKLCGAKIKDDLDGRRLHQEWHQKIEDLDKKVTSMAEREQQRHGFLR